MRPLAVREVMANGQRLRRPDLAACCQPEQDRLRVAHLLAGYLPSLLVHDGDRQRALERIDTCVQPAHLT
jgi:hypothetical protein